MYKQYIGNEFVRESD